ncbi:DNA topoisomerase [Elysia marginata]|uniref:DNA topoisomerase n=1 Tax=Elysia marginata TaxID=1093978 RepID=A0AAV4GKD9_9GAST|nr:DNA topoisomerase [Elysia marginata]
MAHIKTKRVVNNARKKAFTCHQKNRAKAAHISQPSPKTKEVLNKGNEKKIYEYIVRHFLACVSQDAQGHETVVEIEIAQEKFSAQGLMILARNYLDVYPYEKWNAKEIPLYYQGDQFEPNSIEIQAGETSPPPLLTEADLIALMEKHGIGTDATHAEHIETVKARMYVGLRPDGRFVPGQLGMGLVEGYDSMGYEMSKPHLRSQLEADLKLICEGRKAKNDVLRDQIQRYKEVFIEACRQAQKLDEAISQYLGEAQPLPDNEGEADFVPSVIRKCPKCGNPMTLRTKKDNKGFYIGCSAYPNCKASIWLPDFVLQANATQEACQICHPGPVMKLQFKFKPGSVPLTIPNNYVGCIGGCDEMLTEALGIRPLSGPSSGNQTPIVPRTEIRPFSSTNTRPTAINNSRPTNNSVNRRPASSGAEAGRSLPLSAGPPHREFHTRTFSDQSTNARAGAGSGAGGTNRITVTNMSSGSDVSAGGPVSRTSNYRPQSSGPSGLASLNPRGPLSSITNNGGRVGSSGFTGVPGRGSGDDGAQQAIVCSCGNDAIILTVRKEGPNTGRQFYKCSGQTGESCNFFLWADQNGQTSASPSDPNSNFSRGSRESFGGDGFHSSSYQNPWINKKSTFSSGGDDEGGGQICCRCGVPAKSLTVQKQGPNTGRPFYACNKPREQSCNFFQWADQMDQADHSAGGPSMRQGNPFLPPWASGSRGTPAQKKRPAPGAGGSGSGHRKNKCPEREDDF